ncbi:MAG: hypothetical protein IMZ61_16130 [Planctomycetes bacterium]|nr:hypothetical protein [Planctomycetota bacterium]
MWDDYQPGRHRRIQIHRRSKAQEEFFWSIYSAGTKDGQLKTQSSLYQLFMCISFVIVVVFFMLDL